ncbi:MAG: GHKL domain-containing protein [Flavobacteriales bacterium]|nr:GHKL domain-containing protein [Flavobacteriales bacterium]
MRKFLLLFTLTLLVGFSAGFLTDYRESNERELKHAQIELDFQAVDARLQQTIKRVEERTDGLRTYCDCWEKYGIGLVIYDNGLATEWTTNALPFQTSFEERTKPTEGLTKLKNAWYLCRTSEVNGQLLVGYALIETEYGFENRYIKNRWNPAIKDGDHFSVTLSDHETQALHFADGMVAAYVRFSDPHANPAFSRSAALWLVFIALVLMTLWAAANWMLVFTSPSVSVASFIVLTLLFRGLMLWWNLPKALYAIETFGPSLHASSLLVPSLGDLALHLIFGLVMLIRLVRFGFRPSNSRVVSALVPIIQVLLVFPVFWLFQTLVVNSSFSLKLNDPFSLSIYSFVGLTISFIGLLSYFISYKLLNRILPSETRNWRKSIVFWLIGTIGLFLLTNMDASAILVSATALALVIFLSVAEKWLSRTDGLSGYVPLVLAFTILASVMMVSSFHANERESRKALAQKIEHRQNPISEYLFSALEEKIIDDRSLRNLLTVRPMDEDAVLIAIHHFLAYDHWNQYRAVVNMYNQNGGIMVSDQPTVGPNYFELQRDFDASKPTMSKNLRYAGIWNTDGGYLARLELKGRRSQDDLVLFIQLIPEKTDDVVGFTDLFVDEEIGTAKDLEGYSYAIYQNGELQERHGDFAYSLSDAMFAKFKDENTFTVFDGYEHLVNNPSDGHVVVISIVDDGIIDHLTIFSYLFLFYFALATIAVMLEGTLIRGLFTNSSFRSRINLAMGSVLLFSLLLIGALTVFYVVREYNNRNEEMISERSRSVLIVMERRLRERESFSQEDQPMLSELLNRLSKVFFTDVNLYQMNGHLLATSRPRLYDEGLLAKVLDRTAYVEMRFNQRSSFIQEETIGNLKYLTAYVPFRNDKGEVIAIVSLPYFARQYGLQQEIFSLLAALTNIYVFLILISVVVALVISNRITEPLRFIRDSLKNLKLDEANRAIEWNSKDEIGELVDEYNRTLNELVRSAEMLARSERESAWREMAKQVAHEIKNPLTPMKLSIQMLQRSKNDGAEDLGERIDKVTNTLVEQIDTLSNIASEFSSFAQMPKSNIESVDLKHLLESVAELHQNNEVVIVLETQTDGPSCVMADKDQMLRVFNNLIKNAIQAVSEGTNPQIVLRLKPENGLWIVSVTDNGSGIPEELQEKIFVPNFTTKTSGMGLGLAMVKNIVESANGKIWFETSESEGTTFYVSFPTA